MTADYDFEKLLSYLLELTEFPPLVYSLRVLFEQSYLSISGWVCGNLSITGRVIAAPYLAMVYTGFMGFYLL